MKVTLFGAAGCVTGSAYYVRSKKAAVLVDFGIFQGEKSQERNNSKLPRINISTLNSVIITHGNPDHCGRLPILARNGYRGPVFATEATTLIQCKKIGPFPLILVNKKFWKNVKDLTQYQVDQGAVGKDEIGFALRADSPKKAVKTILKRVPEEVIRKLSLKKKKS